MKLDANTKTARQHLRGYLSQKRPLNEMQEIAWWALNDLELYEQLLRKCQRERVLSLPLQGDLDALVSIWDGEKPEA
jgi:hypothetical protein